MPANFEKAYLKTIGHEGGYANHPSDRGGETWKGIARNFWKDWEGWQIIDEYKRKENFPANLKDVERLDRMVKEFYKKNFWDKLFLDQLAEAKVSTELFDTAVNMGVKTAAKMLQEALNLLNRQGLTYADLDVDGIVGARTIYATNRCNQRNLYITLNLLQGERYMNICRNNPTQEVFFNGWLNRVEL
jgi:lysozyme family protein